MKGLLNVLQDSENELKRQVKDLESQIKSTSQENESKFDVLNDNITVLEQEIKGLYQIIIIFVLSCDQIVLFMNTISNN